MRVVISRMKKAQANMFWVIIGAVLAIIVLVVLVYFFGRGTEKVALGLSECESKLGKCVSKDICEKDGGSVTGLFECSQGEVCCFGLKKQTT